MGSGTIAFAILYKEVEEERIEINNDVKTKRIIFKNRWKREVVRDVKEAGMIWSIFILKRYNGGK